MPAHAEKAVDCGFAFISKMKRFSVEERRPLSLRIGLSTGTVVAGLVGTESRASYDVCGDPVLVAALMESNGQSNRVQVRGAWGRRAAVGPRA